MRRVILVLAVALVLGGCADHEDHDRAAPTSTVASTVAASGYPKPSVTPGVVLTTRSTDVCTPGWAARHRKSLTAQQKTVVLWAYGYPKTQRVAEWDHLVSLELGGGNGPANVFPMVDRAQALRKDRLEGRLHDQVCAGHLDLVVAQAEIRQFWKYW